jgi:hypothetical protein
MRINEPGFIPVCECRLPSGVQRDLDTRDTEGCVSSAGRQIPLILQLPDPDYLLLG